ncbi:hypothetical protein [Polyangium jinanense]|uniref:Uncharacterized protein n=1 Tax=Polyangium jinanense TaxID=2829994 RepID=A0A9X3XBZ0_9BACT|nr:hypothetical protein [Polyangium jinanense]MDC3958778.1 hypothetical protein [Polyangium jinanense]MDC3985241.1 hypothetical protein [Polyangium jinanense]
MDSTDETPRTPLECIDGEPFVFAAVSPIPGRSPRLGLPLACVGPAIDHYSSQHAPQGLVAYRLRRGDVAVLDDVTRALSRVPEAEGSDAGTAYGYRVCALLCDDSIGPKIVSWLESCLADESIPRAARAALARTIASDPRCASLTLDALFASAVVDDEARQTYAARCGAGQGARTEPSEPEPDDARRALLANPFLAVRELRDGAREVLAAHPELRGDVLAALTVAVTDETEQYYVRFHALEQLAELDRAYAVAIAEMVEDPRMAPLVAPLVKFPEPGALARYAHNVGLLPELTDGELRAVTIENVLGSRTALFAKETDEYPNHYDRVLARLARLVSPVLDDVLFEEVPHHEFFDDDDDDEDDDEDAYRPVNDPDQLRDAYRLRAFLPDCTYEIIAGNTTDWITVEPVLGLLNTLCEARGSDLRFVELPTGSQDACVLAAPARAIQTAVDEGILVVIWPS